MSDYDEMEAAFFESVTIETTKRERMGFYNGWKAAMQYEREQCAKICDSAVADIGEFLPAKLEYMRGCREEALRLGNNIRDRK